MEAMPKPGTSPMEDRVSKTQVSNGPTCIHGNTELGSHQIAELTYRDNSNSNGNTYRILGSKSEDLIEGKLFCDKSHFSGSPFVYLHDREVGLDKKFKLKYWPGKNYKWETSPALKVLGWRGSELKGMCPM